MCSAAGELEECAVWIYSEMAKVAYEGGHRSRLKVCTHSIDCLLLFVNPVMDHSNQWL